MKLENLYDVSLFIYSDTDGCGYSLVGRDVRPRVCDTDTLLEYELIQSVVDFLQEGREMINESTYQQLKTDWATSPPPISQNEWDYETVDDCLYSPMWFFFYDLAGGTPGLIGQHHSHTLSPLQHVHFTPFRRLGFAIWSQARLQGYGFLPLPLPLIAEEGFVRMSESAPVYTAWRSVLTTDERAEVERKNKWWDDETMVTPTFSSQEYLLQQRKRSTLSSMDMEEEDEEEMGPPVLDWKRHFLRQKRRILSAMEDEDEDEGKDEDQNEDAENDEISVCADPASSP